MRLIDADAFERKLMFFSTRNDIDDSELIYVLDNLKLAPTLDAMPVVRCENCKHAETDKIGCYCTLHDDRVAENGFCSYGERKGGGNA